MGNIKPTIQDVAKRAGVSTATVSRALTNSDAVTQETKRHVLLTAAEMGYTVSETKKLRAHTLNPQKRFILAAVPTFASQTITDVITGISSYAENHDCKVIVMRVHLLGETLDEIMKTVRRLNVCGIILMGYYLDHEIVEKIDREIPVVLCGENADETNLYSVNVNYYDATVRIVNYFLDDNRKAIGLIRTIPRYDAYIPNDVLNAVRDTLEARGMEANPHFFVGTSSQTFDLAVMTAHQLLDDPAHRPDAVLSLSDIYGLALVKVAQKNGIRIPKELSIICFDNTYLLRTCTPALSSMNNPKFDIGNLSTQILIGRVEGNNNMPRKIRLDADLIIRDS